ncbi:MAG: LytTR family transcriptional regulator DNA-binding domain-containing protein [Lachnospiraceae bacterium]|nr:LytTR family transcriptional regulator DNA-binding domain-containing protein [Lachnospiraceae bacterium]
MISCLVIDAMREERAEITELLRYEAAHLSEDEWNMEAPERKAQLAAALEQEYDMACLDVTAKGMLLWTEQFRKKHEKAFVLIIADTTIPPTVYLKPSIMPTSLILRPPKREEMQKTLRELAALCVERLREKDGGEAFVVEERGERTFLEYSKICYFESREKKVFARCAAKEYGFYDTLDHLTEILPDYFVRCHRGFIINQRKVTKILLGQNCIELEQGMTIPVSRSYRAEVRKLKG